MTAYVVLLRGVNVGKAKRISMAQLRTLLEGLGSRDVRTHLNSGNAVLTASRTTPERLGARVEAALSEQLGLEASCLVRAAADLQAVVSGNPWPERAGEGSKLLAHFLSADPDPVQLAAHDPRGLDPERIALGHRVMYQWCPDGVLAAPPAATMVTKRLGVTVTGRNWNTVTKLAEMIGD